ncbi:MULTISPECIES: YbaB/EbfC family nucleoid-associated protein [unclassified Nocardia]|uniref:YbaB/EbfC family nucleoid-associated protein n=1 Tax=unclassified Nocardia TaxID=2637762 RepID=UPI001CE3D4F7|nr:MULTISPECIES: YbaB/EbfC family nucleoid-associated protein [unclassified Nocardia]
MDASEKAALEARSEALDAEVQSMLTQFEQQQRDIAAAQAEMSQMTAEAWSSDKLVRVVCNAAGVPKEVHLAAEAFRRSTPEKLGRSMAEAAQAAAASAAERARQAFAPIAEMADAAPDLSDLVPGAPGIKDLFQSMFPQPDRQESPEPVLDEEEEDEYYRNSSYLKDRR